MSLFNDDQKNNYLLQLHSELIAIDNLSLDYHLLIGGSLYEQVVSGFGNIKDPFSIEATTLTSLRNNIYQFSAAKQYQQVRLMSSFLMDSKGRKRSFDEFRKRADSVFDDYNVNYLQTELDTAFGEAQNARQWMDIERDKDAFPFLQYNTQEDELVRETHKPLDGIIKRVDDPFWNTFMPLNGWNCRCFVTQLDEAVETNTDNLEVNEKDFPELFRFNPGKTKKIFDNTKHPYFKVGRGHASLRDNNFNLPLP